MYKLHKNILSGEITSVVKSNENGSFSSIPFDEANTDYQDYLAWLEEGNTPEPADEVQGETQ